MSEQFMNGPPPEHLNFSITSQTESIDLGWSEQRIRNPAQEV